MEGWLRGLSLTAFHVDSKKGQSGLDKSAICVWQQYTILKPLKIRGYKPNCILLIYVNLLSLEANEHEPIG